MINLIAKTATREELIDLLSGTEEQRQELERENARLRRVLQKMYDAPNDCLCEVSDETIAIWAEARDILSNVQSEQQMEQPQ